MNTQASACERLAQSRERLRQAMQKNSSRTGNAGDVGADSLLGDVLSAWWEKQPLRVILLLAAASAKELVQPLAKRNPVLLVLGAAAVGALLVRVRPWRWIALTRPLVRLLPQMIAEALKQLPLNLRGMAAPNHHDTRS